MKVKSGQVWRDKKNGNLMYIEGKHHDIVYNCTLIGSKVSHKMTGRTINKYYEYYGRKEGYTDIPQ